MVKTSFGSPALIPFVKIVAVITVTRKMARCLDTLLVYGTKHSRARMTCMKKKLLRF